MKSIENWKKSGVEIVKIIVLGAAAGGGFPQWNCNCALCRLARTAPEEASPRTQSSLAVSADGRRWLLLNASPDVRQQINQTPAMHPAEGDRHSPISAIVMSNADVDHIGGLLTLRESQPYVMYGTQRVLSVLADNSIFNVVNRDLVARNALSLDQPTRIVDANGEALGLEIELFSVPGKVALFLEDAAKGPKFGSVEEDTVGIQITETAGGRSFNYIPGCAACPPELEARIRDSALLLFDGTTWTNEEMITLGVGHKTGKRMGHMSMSGDNGSIAAFAKSNIARKIFVHINNTNPVLHNRSAERAVAEEAGWEVSFDGMEIAL
jgi:pyrroloquinoline quinone biosynthesis protein B